MSKPDILSVGTSPDWDSVPMHATYSVWEMDEGGTPDHLLGIIANFGVGYDTIDVSHAVSRGITVTNTPDILTEDVADLAIGMMIAWSRSIPGAQEWVKSGEWAARGEYRLQRKVSGKRAGIVGLGRIGRAVAERLVPFNIEISYFSRTEKPTPGWTHYSDIAALATEVDVLFVCVSGGPTTRNLIGTETLIALGKKGLLINVSRGTTIDETALLNALESEQIAGAALDVFLKEPKIDARFLDLSNVLLSPHQSSGTIETRKAMGELQRANLAAYFSQKPLITPVPECV